MIQLFDDSVGQLAGIRHVALDMDGTIYRGGALLKGAHPFLRIIGQLNIGYSFMTNNSSKSTEEYIQHLARFGIPAARNTLFTSTHATIELLRDGHPDIASVFVAGTHGLRREFRDAGFQVLPFSSAKPPDAVVVGFDPRLDFKIFCKTAFWVEKGLPYFATHPDTTCPTDEQTVLLDCGSLCAAIAAAVGRRPDATAGKPNPRMLHSLCQRLGLQSNEVAMVGDRLNTDILMAIRAGSYGVLTLTGETKRPHLETSDFHPDLVVENLSELAALLSASRDF